MVPVKSASLAACALLVLGCSGGDLDFHDKPRDATVYTLATDVVPEADPPPCVGLAVGGG